MQEKEVWKPIKGYEGRYEVSNFGNVKSLNFNKTGKEKLLKPRLSHNGYFRVILYNEFGYKSFFVHRLVAYAFILNNNQIFNNQINHKDEDKTNNSASNLEWCSCEYNNNYGTRTEKTFKRVLQYTKEGAFIKKWESLTHIEKELGYLHGNISLCCNGKCKYSHGFIWRFE